MTEKDFGQRHIDLMIEFNRRFIAGDQSAWVPRDAIVVFLPEDQEHREYHLRTDLGLIDEGHDVYFKRLDLSEEPSRSEQSD